MKHTDSELFCRGVAAQSGGLEFGIGSRRPNGLSRVWEAPPPAEPGFGSLSLAMTASSSAGRGVRPCSAPQARRGKAQGVGRPWGASGFQSSRLTGLLTQQPKAASVGTAGKLSSNSNAVSLVSKRDSSLGIEKTRASGASLFFPDPLAVPAAPPAQRGRPDGVVFWRSAIIWFRSDLRLHDNEALSTAFREASSVVPVYCFDPREFGRSQTGFHQTGAYKARFLLECVTDLRLRLREIGSELVVRVGQPEEVIAKLVCQASSNVVFCHSEVTLEETEAQQRVEAAIKGEGAQLRVFWGSTLYHRDDLPSRTIPTNYAAFREMVKDTKVRSALDAPRTAKGLPIGCDIEAGKIPTLSDLGIVEQGISNPQGALLPKCSPLSGGEGEALRQVEAFLKELGSPAHKRGKAYSTAHNKCKTGHANGATFSCKISPWLALGCLSPRLLYEKVAAQDKQEGSKRNKQHNAGSGTSPGGLSWLLFELMWRDFFRFITSKDSAARNPATTKGTQATISAC